MITTDRDRMLNAVMSLPSEVQAKYMEEYHLDGNSHKALLRGEERSLDKYYTFDELGHIMFVTTSPDANEPAPAVVELFQKVTVFYTAMTAALGRSGLSLMDYDAVNKIIASSGLFASVQKEKRTYSSKATKVSLNTAIISHVLGPGVTAGGIEIAKRVINAIGSELKGDFSKETASAEVSHVLFVCELLMGIPVVSLALFHSKKEQLEWVQSTSCSEVSHKEVKFEYEGDHYMFADPAYIKQFAEGFDETPEYTELIDRLAGYIDNETEGSEPEKK